MKENVYYFRSPAVSAVVRRLPKRYRKHAIENGAEPGTAFDTPAVVFADASRDPLKAIEKRVARGDGWKVIYVLTRPVPSRDHSSARVFAVLPQKPSREVLLKTLESAFQSLRAASEGALAKRQLHSVASELETLNRIGIALSTERSTDALLELILTKSREITGCDAGSLYLAEENPDGARHLVFKLTQSDSHSVPFRQFTLPIDTRSIAGYVAARGEALNIRDAYRIRNMPFRLNRDFDEKFGYRTQSLLVLPMKNQKDEVIGVLQLINAKKHPSAKLSSIDVVRKEVIPFSARSQELAASLASQAAVAVENNILYHNIRQLFEGFVRASVTAIESRDPTTFGHSERVAKLTVGLAQAVDRSDAGPYKDIRFTREELQELHYASLLHDFGKVGVREEVLVKAKKLYPSQLDLVSRRFQYIRKVIELESNRRKLEHVLKNGNQSAEEAFAKLDAELAAEIKNLDAFYEAILKANEPSVLPEKASEQLAQIATWTFHEPGESSEPLLAPEELRLLSIPKGSLDSDERLQIESHVIHSFRFLSKIPWTKELRRIPEIARAHHEKLDGSGYPYHMKAEEIPFQAKMMTISDIYDALTARDRPYKRAVPVERALNIIGDEVKSQLLDPLLYQLFIEAKIFDLTAKD